MLHELILDNLGAIEHAEVHLTPGFTVLTGETGVGKTMLAVGLRLLCGGRGDAARVRGGAERALVQGRFELTDSPLVSEELREFLTQAGVDLTEEDILVMRTLSKDGRSKAYISGRAVPLGILASFTEPLMNVHGQHDQLRLLRGAEQLQALDRYATDPLAPTLDTWRRVWARHTALRTQLTELHDNDEQRHAETLRLTDGLQRIDEINPQAGEDIRILDEIRRLSDVDQLREQAHTAHVLLTGDDPERPESHTTGATSALAHAAAALSHTDDPALQELADRATEVGTLVSELSLDVGAYLSELPADSSLLEAKLDRQAQLKTLVRAYATDVDGVLQWAVNARDKLATLSGGSDTLAQLHDQLDAVTLELDQLAATLTSIRENAAISLEKAVNEELAGLSMGSSALVVTVHTTPQYGPTGANEVVFALRTAGSAHPVPLAKGASGGELSRIMLALELVLAHDQHNLTMVFDEVDSGVGGRAAVGIGQRLARLGHQGQVLAVTHLPQVAAYADAHIRIEGATGKSAHASSVCALQHEERVLELARMLAGLAETDTGRAHAEELLSRAQADPARNQKTTRRKKASGGPLD